MANREGYLGSIELCSFFRESSAVPQMHEEFSTSHKSHDEEDLLLSLENVMHANKERVVCLHQDIFLKLSALNLIIIDDDIFPQRFHSIYLFASFLLNQKHFTEASSSNNFLDQEILKSDLFISCSGIESLRCLSEPMIF